VLPFLDPTLPAREIDWADDRPILQIFFGGLNSVSCTRFRDRRPQDQIFRNLAIKNGRAHGGRTVRRFQRIQGQSGFLSIVADYYHGNMMILGDNRNPNRYSHTMNISNFAPPRYTSHCVILLHLSYLIDFKALFAW
jgi:hypothetical protein